MDGYVRVSRRMGRAGAGYISPRVQRDAIQRWADYRGIEIVAWHVDEDQSGGTQNRPGLREAIRRVEAGETDGVACWRLNRFARNVSSAIVDVERIHAAGGHLACIEEDIDPTGPFGRFILTILLAVATLERDNAVAGFEEAKRRAVARGAYVSRTPWGYERKADGTLAPHPQRAAIVSEAFRLAAGDSLRAATDYLRSVAPERKWSATKTRRLLGQRSYLGETRNGDLVQADTHEPLVSRAVWEAAQTAPADRRPRQSFPLSGLLRCETCGGPMIGSRGGIGQRTYRCSNSQTGRCEKGANVTAELVEDYLRDLARERIGGARAVVSDPGADVLTLLERQIADAEAELDAFAGDLTLRRALGDRYHQHLQARVDAVERARAGYREQARRQETRLALSAEDLLERPEGLRLALGGMFASIVVRAGRNIPVGDRLVIVPFDGDGTSGELSAE